MKIDKKNIRHWMYLVLFGLNVIAAIVLRLLRKKNERPQLLLYGHKLSGNLLALYKHIKKNHQGEFDISFLTMDEAYHRQLVSEGTSSVLATRIRCLDFLVRADAVISDHGLHVMSLMLSFSNLQFFDVWHGIPFKGFDADDFRVQHRYNECWVASPLLKKMYVEKFGFDQDRVKVTGYARTDCLVSPSDDLEQVKLNFGLDPSDLGKVVLFAPTWKQDAQQRSIFPFGTEERSFLGALSDIAVRTNSTFILRAHLNSNSAAGNWPRIVQIPYAQYPDTEALLRISDVLVCDWSSIAFDYLLLGRPAIFLDVEPPFAKGFSLGPEFRFGQVVACMDELLQFLHGYLNDPGSYADQHLEEAEKVREKIYGPYADGSATERCVQRLHGSMRR